MPHRPSGKRPVERGTIAATVESATLLLALLRLAPLDLLCCLLCDLLCCLLCYAAALLLLDLLTPPR